MTFDDTNGIGTLAELADKVLAGTGWHRGWTDPILEEDGVTEKVRSITSGGKEGALGLITRLCNLFKCYPVYDSNEKTVAFYNFNNRTQILEGTVGVNLDALNIDYNSKDIITRLYVEGEYGDNGYVGIDDVNPTGLSYIMNFDYYLENGLMSAAQVEALETYIDDVSAVKAAISAKTREVTEVLNTANSLVGQCMIALYYPEIGFTSPTYVYGDPTVEQRSLAIGNEVVVLNNNGTFRREIITDTPEALIQTGDYGIAKFITPAAGSIGAKEVQIEAKEKQIENLQKKIDRTYKETTKEEYRAEIAALEDGIEEIYTMEDGLYAQMHSMMNHDGYMKIITVYNKEVDELQVEMDDIEADFIIAMGDLLRDGYWSNQNYVPGQEQYLYNDAALVLKEMSRPTATYSIKYMRMAEEFGIPLEDIQLNAVLRINDDELNVYDNLFITKKRTGIDHKDEGGIEISNKDITINTNDLGALLSRMSQLADLIEQKNTLYERAKAITKNGTLYTDRLNGQLDVLKTQIMSTVSNWYTDDQGNIMFEAADGGSAMMLSGAGLLLANERNEDGTWNWRTAMDGTG